MSLYELLLFCHIVATIVWVGAGLMSLVLAAGYDRDGDARATERLLGDQEWLSKVLFIPASLLTVLFGIALVIESEAWSFGQLWIVLGLIGFAITFFTGLLLIKPASERIAEQVGRDGGTLTPDTLLDVQRLLTKARVDYVVLLLVIGDMVVKPTGDDVGVLVGMAVIAALGVGYVAARLRGLEATPRPAAP